MMPDKQHCSNETTGILNKYGGMPGGIQIQTSTTRRSDGREQVFCGIVLDNQASPMDTSAPSSSRPSEQDLRPDTEDDDKDEGIPAAFKSSTIQGVYEKLGYPANKCRFCDATMWFEERVSGSNQENITFSICCQEGKVSLEKLVAAPEPLYSLLRDQGPEGTAFRSKIRIYNSLFCFTSFASRVDEKINASRGPYTFRISGQNYHRVGSLLPQTGTSPRYAQLYFYDTENELRNRMGCMNLKHGDVDENVVRELMSMLDANSSVAKAFRMARNWCSVNTTHDVTLKLIGERHPRQKQYNMPNVSEVAALVVGDFGQSGTTRDILIEKKTGGLQRISEIHPQYMALQYPLLFPYGEDGYHVDISYKKNTGKRQTKRGNVTMREFYCYRIQQRLTESTTLIEATRLFNQYLVDSYSGIEDQRLAWIRFHQDELRADLYNNIIDAVNKGDTEAKAIGKRIVLPATFTGSPRYMQQNYQDAMALCRSFGNPALFITFTANPKWPEVAEMLSAIPSQTAQDRPDIMTRIFKLKLTQLMQDLRKNKIFGKSQASVYTIEFQKRGLPHAHILLWLKRKNKTALAAEIDDIISAEIPCKIKDPQAHKLVADHMIHGPCGKANKNAPCMIGQECSKHFPKPFYAATTVDEEGFPVYRRRNNGATIKKGRAELDNRHVVPYNQYLLMKYQGHINVEWCNQSRAIKYLFKYINKDPDKATAMVVHGASSADTAAKPQYIEVDEIKIYQDCRYLSSCEAVWRIYGFEIHSCIPAVINLPLHLPDGNIVVVRDSNNLASVLNRPGVKETMFTAWFELNRVDPRARNITYAEIPCKYVWNAKNRLWQWRKQRKGLGRIVYCHPASGERYYLRMLLNTVRGPRSYEEIRTVNGVLYDTFKQTCYALGMLTDDKEWTDAIQEAKLWATGTQLRNLFVTILVFCDVLNPGEIWQQNWDILSEDILYHKRKEFRFPNLELSEHQLKNYSLFNIEEILSRNGKSLADFPEMPMPDKSLLTVLDNRLIQEEMSYNISMLIEEHEILHSSLNSQQRTIYDEVVT